MSSGQFKQGSLEGHGTAVMFDGSKYTGILVVDKVHGTAYLTFPPIILCLLSLELTPCAGIFFYLQGEWKADRFEGWGRVEYSDNSIYEGELHAGEREGQVRALFSCT